MTIQTDLRARLSDLVAGRVYPLFAPEQAASPFIVYTRLSATENNTLAANGGTGNLTNTRLQVDVYAETYTAAQDMAAQVVMRLKGWNVTCVVNVQMDLFEEDTRLYRVMTDISTWHTDP